MRALRGATTIDADTAAEVGVRTKELLDELYERNDLQHEQVVSVLFTATKDIASAPPAVAARAYGLTEVALLCAQEMDVEGSLPRCIRVLLHIESEVEKRQLRHVFLREATVLRPDLVEPDPR